MLSFLLLVSISLGANVYICTFSTASVAEFGNCVNFIEIDDSLVKDSVETSHCLASKESSTKVTKVNNGTDTKPEYHFYVYTYNTNYCTLKDDEPENTFEVSNSNTVDVTTMNVVGTVTYTFSDTESAKEYYIGGGCYSYFSGVQFYYHYIASQFGISFHLYNEASCSGSERVTEIITTFDFNEKQVEIKIIDMRNPIFSLESDENNIREEVPLTAEEEIPNNPQTIYELISTTEGKVLELNGDTGYYEVSQVKRLYDIELSSVVATGNAQVINKLKNGGILIYFTDSCYNNKTFNIIGNVFVEIIYSEEECLNVESISPTNQNNEITIEETLYIVGFKGTDSIGIKYKEISGLVYAEYNLGKCLKTKENTSEQYLIDLYNKIYCVSYSTTECSTITNFTLVETVDTKPFEGNTTVTVIDSYKCNITEIANAVKSSIVKVNECSETIKFVIENKQLVQYSYNTSQECVSGVGAKTVEKYDCNSCLADEKYLICPSDPVVEESSSSTKSTNEDDNKSSNDDSSSISFMIAGIAIITFFIY